MGEGLRGPGLGDGACGDGLRVAGLGDVGRGDGLPRVGGLETRGGSSGEVAGEVAGEVEEGGEEVSWPAAPGDGGGTRSQGLAGSSSAAARRASCSVVQCHQEHVHRQRRIRAPG
jgi:hypothetical protein